jgi:hypothetical protein
MIRMPNLPQEYDTAPYHLSWSNEGPDEDMVETFELYLGDYQASIYGREAHIHYRGLPAELRMSITLDYSLSEERLLMHPSFETLQDWAEQHLIHRYLHGHSGADVTSSSGPATKLDEPSAAEPWHCGKRYHDVVWMECQACVEAYNLYRQHMDGEGVQELIRNGWRFHMARHVRGYYYVRFTRMIEQFILGPLSGRMARQQYTMEMQDVSDPARCVADAVQMTLSLVLPAAFV